MTTPDLTPAGIATRRAKRRSRSTFTWRGKLIGAVIAALFVGMLLTSIVTVAIWPGEVKLFAPIVCSDARPDPVVVYDTHNVRPGETSVTFEMYCMGPRGDVEAHGFGKLLGLAMVFHTLLVLALIGGLIGWNRLRKARKARPARRRKPKPEPNPNPLIS